MSFIDERIVKMKFDNSEFESRVTPTINSLNQLNEATNSLTEKSSGINSLGKAFEKAEIMSTQAGFHIKDVWLKVASVLEYQVAGKIVNVGKQIANAFTFEGIANGFKEYELKMGSIQTIMAGTGESLAKVNAYLDELNRYADQTIYSFSDMTRNIGKFTNAGVKLEDAVAAIKGIANEAAVSGANANEASRAMYNFSQALSMGKVLVRDWMSIENANMATKEFKETLLEVASVVGTVQKESNGMYQVLTRNGNGKVMTELINGTKGFRDSLQQQWLTTEVLTKALKIYATDVLSKDVPEAVKKAYEEELRLMGFNEEQIKKFEELGQKAAAAATEIKTFTMLIDTLKEAIGSGWAMTWQNIIGDFDEAKELWTEVGNILGDMINKQSTLRNDMLEEWDRLGGRKKIIDALKNSFDALVNTIRPIGEAMQSIFPAMTGGRLAKMSQDLKDFSVRLLEVSEKIAPKVRSAAKGFFAIIDMGLNLIKSFINVIAPFEATAKNLANSFLDAAANVGEFLAKLDRSIKESKLFEQVFRVILVVIAQPIRYILEHADAIITFITSVIKVATGLVDIVKSVGSVVISTIKLMVTAFNKGAGPMHSASEIIAGVFDRISEAIDNVREKIVNINPFFEGVASLLSGVGGALGKLFKAFGDGIRDLTKGDATDVITMIMGFINAFISGEVALGIHRSLQSVTELGKMLHEIKEVIEKFGFKMVSEGLVNIAKAIAILSGSLWLLATIDTDRLLASAGALVSIMAGLALAMNIIMKATVSFSSSQVQKTEQTLKNLLSTLGISLNKFTKFASLSSMLLVLGKTMIELSIALKIISSTVSDGTILPSFIVLTGILGELTGIVLILDKFSKFDMKGVKGLTSMAISLNLVVIALRQVSNELSEGYDKTFWAVTVISALLMELTGIVIIIDKFTTFKLSALTGLISMGLSLNLVVLALKQVSDTIQSAGGWTILEAFAIITALLAEVSAATIALSMFGKWGLLGAAGAILASAALLIVVQSLKQVSNMLGQTNQHVWGALDVITASLIILAGGLTLMIAAYPGAAALIKAAEGLVILAGALKIFGTMSVWDMAKAITAIAASLAVLAVELTAMIIALPGALALQVIAKAVAELGAAMLVLGSVPWKTLGAFLAKFTVVVPIFTLLASVLSLLSPFVLAFAGALAVLSLAMKVAGPAMITFSAGLQAVWTTVPLFSKAVWSMLETVFKAIPELARAIGEALVVIAKTIAEYGPVFGEAAVVAIQEILKAIVNSAKDFALAMIDLIAAMLNTIAYAIPTIVEAGANIVIAIMRGIAETVPRLIDAGYRCVIAFFVGMGDAIMNNTENLVYATNYMMDAVWYAILNRILNMPILGKLIPEALKEGILGNTKIAVDAARELVDDTALELDDLSEKGEKSAEGLLDRIISKLKGEKKNAVVNAAGELGDETVAELDSKSDDAGNAVSNWLASMGIEFDNSDLTEKAKSFGLELSDGLLAGLPDTSNFTEELNKLAQSLGLTVTGIERVGDASTKSAMKVKQLKTGLKLLSDDTADYGEKQKQSIKTTKQQTEATDDYTAAITAASTATSTATKETKKQTNVMEYASGVVNAFANTYGHLYSGLGDVSAYDVATIAVKNLAESTYEASVRAQQAGSMNEDTAISIEKMIEQFTNLKEKVYDSIKSMFSGDSFFQEFEVKTEKTMAEILGAMQSNVNAVDNWTTQIAELGRKGISEGLLQQLAELGPKGFEYVNAFSNATAEEIQRANELFAHAGALPEDASNTIVASYAMAGLDAVTGFANGIFDNTGLATKNAQNLGLTTLDTLKKALDEHSPSRKTNQMGKWLCEGLRDGMNESKHLPITTMAYIAVAIVDQAKERLAPSIFIAIGTYAMVALANGMMSEEVDDAMRRAYNKMYYYGEMIGEGLAAGLRASKAEVEEAAKELSKAASKKTKEENEIESPSHLYRRYGKYIGEGLALGITDSISDVESSADKMSEAIRNTLSKVETIAEDDMELHPVIAPVLDLSQVKTNAALIGSLFPGQSMAMASSISIGRTNGYELDSSSNDAQNAAPASINFTQNNYSPKALDRYEIYRQTKNQVSLLKGALA